MRKIFVITLWEIKKLIGNWRKAIAIFLLPAVLMMAALNLFPVLINYLTTGSFGATSVIIVDSPDSFTEYLEGIEGRSSYRFTHMNIDEIMALDDDEITSLYKKGNIIVVFAVNGMPGVFDSEVTNYYQRLTEGYTNTFSNARIEISYDGESPGMESKAIQFQETIITPYQDQIVDVLGGEYASMGANPFTVNEFNPVGKILDYRSVANRGASRIIPSILVLLMYYCTYALVSDIFAAEKDRGFYNKLILTPVSRKSIFTGKLLAILGVVTLSSIITFVMMFFASWLNRSNDPMSLLPFGMFLTPGQLIIILLEIVPAAFLMGVITVNIVFNTEKMQDTVACLQFPLILFLFEFFIHMFRGTRPLTLEFFVPLHNSIQAMRDVFMSEHHLSRMVIAFVVNTCLAFYIFNKTIRKELSR